MARILVVDDVRFILQMIVGIFRDRGHDVLSAEDGNAALDVAFRKSPDLVLLDTAMPGLDGVAVAQRLREHPPTRETPILMLSSKSDQGTIDRALEAGANDHVSKPFDIQDLLAKAAALLGGYRMHLSVEELGGVTLVAVLSSDVDEEIGEHFESAWQDALDAGRPIVLDLARATRVEPHAAETILRCVGELDEGRRPLAVVEPGKGVGTRALAQQLEREGEVFATRREALDRAGWDPASADEESTPEEAPDAPLELDDAPDAPQEPAGPADGESSCAFDTIGTVVMVRATGPSLSAVLPEIHQEVVGGAHRSVLLAIKRIVEVGEEDISGIRTLANALHGTGRTFRIVDASPEIAEVLESEGLGNLVSAPSRNGSSGPRG